MKKLIVLAMMLTMTTTLFADNMVLNYFKKWVDETKVESAISDMILTRFISDLPKEYSVSEDSVLSANFEAYADKCGFKKTYTPKVMIVNCDVPDEILLPGGVLILTKGYLDYAKKAEQREFILARNAFLMVRKQPLAAIKHNGMYPKFLDYLKTPEAKRTIENSRDLVRQYLKSLPEMNHKQADVQGALITLSPENTRKAAIELLSNFSVRIWPPLPFDTVDLPSRINELENIKLPEQKL